MEKRESSSAHSPTSVDMPGNVLAAPSGGASANASTNTNANTAAMSHSANSLTASHSTSGPVPLQSHNPADAASASALQAKSLNGHASLGTSPPQSAPTEALATMALSSASASASIPHHSLGSPLSPVADGTLPTDAEEMDANRGHVQEVERIIEYGGPNAQYAKLNTILGRGAYKTVWKGLDREEGIEVAWNILETTKNEYSELVQETEILKKVRHPNVIHFHDSWYANGEFVFITELMTSGTLREYIKKLKSPSMKIIKRWARQILKGLHYLHSQSPPIIHRDIKCDNIFINGSHGEVKIGDMGTAKMKFGKKYTVIGTPEFMAPEMYEEKGYSEKVDIYAFGMCLLEMVTGEYPYNECKNAAQIYKKVSQGIKPECLAKVEDKEVLSIILNCLAPEHERWSARKLLEHPFFAEDPDVSLLSVDESRTKLTIQVVFKGSDKQTVKFDFNTERDTAENVVNEMIEEQILSSKFRQFVTAAIHKVLRDLAKNVGTPDDRDATATKAPPVPPRISSTPIVASGSAASLSQPAKIAPVFGERAMNELQPAAAPSGGSPVSNVSVALSAATPTSAATAASLNYKEKIVPPAPGLSSSKKTFGPDVMNYDFEPLTRDYPNDFPIEDFVLDVATSCNRDADKAKEWLLKLNTQDIMTVGDLRDLLEDDWAHLNLTVFASRALKNGMQSARKQSTAMSPRLSVANASATKTPVNLPSPSLAPAHVLSDMETL